MITFRTMGQAEIERIGEIDRSEEIRQAYVCHEGGLRLRDVHWSVPRWAPSGQGAHTVSGKILEWRPLLENGGILFGAFDGQSLVGFAIYRPNLAPGTAQLAVLHVSRPYRRQHIGAVLAAKVIEAARADGVKAIYVSATPTRATVEFYESLGFRPTREVNEALFRLEPEDIHMTMNL